jgi:hypothetical protein
MTIRDQDRVSSDEAHLILDTECAKAFIQLFCQVISRMAFLESEIQYIHECIDRC